MEEIKFDLIEKVCEKQNFDELLLQIVKSNKENRINRILQNIEENKKFDKKLKRQIYEGIFDYVDDVNKYLKNNLKKIFSIAAKETIIQINSELNGGNVDMWRKIKVIIADDNVHFCKFIREYLEKYNDIEIQVELILRALELYGYNLEYMLNSNDATDEQKQEKISMLKYTYEQVLASQAEQVDTKANNINNLSSLGKLLSNNFVQTQQKNNLKAI